MDIAPWQVELVASQTELSSFIRTLLKLKLQTLVCFNPVTQSCHSFRYSGHRLCPTFSPSLTLLPSPCTLAQASLHSVFILLPHLFAGFLISNPLIALLHPIDLVVKYAALSFDPFPHL